LISGKDEEIGNNNHELPEGEDGEPDQGAIVEEVTEKDRLQQKQGTSNLLTNPAFVKHLQVSRVFLVLRLENRKIRGEWLQQK
jgi:hypothetical protein